MNRNWLIAVILLMLGLPCVLKADNQGFDAIKADYLILRNRDPEMNSVPQWQRVVERLTSFAEKNSNSKEAPQALFDAARVFELLYRRHLDEGHLQKELKLLKRLYTKYPKSALSDDSLMRIANVLADDWNEQDAARKLYQEILDRYPLGDMYQLARARLSGEKISKGPMKELTKTLTGPIIVIDPGHGGDDLGAVGVGGLYEKDVTLAVALQLEQILQESLNARVILTRRTDIFVPLSSRTAMANEQQAALFISLHTNASLKKNLNGFEIFYLDNSDEEGSRKLADRENRSTGHAGSDDDISFMLSDLIQNAKLDDSRVLANKIHAAVAPTLKNWGAIKSLGVRKGPFYVLVGAYMPCVLVEMFFIDHPVEGKYLASPKFRSDLAQALANGISSFLSHTGQSNS